MELSVLKQGILLFWAVWFTLVFFANVLDGLKALGLLENRWKLASGNWVAIKETTAIYKTPAWLAPILFTGVVVWEGLSTVLMWRALLAFAGLGDQLGLSAVYAAFGVGLALFAAFLIADEIFVGYAMGAKHMLVFLTLIVSLLAIQLLPDGL